MPQHHDRQSTPATLAVVVAAALLATATGPAPAAEPTTVKPDTPPLSPQQSMKVTHLHEGYRLELVAAEPLVMDPVAIDFGPDGRLWVAEMADYPLGEPGHGEVGPKDYDKMRPGGRIRFLTDTDNDGRYDHATLFADKLTMPNGVMVWRDGVLVTSANAVLFLRDTDNDGVADERHELFTGFAVNNPQLRINSLRYGLDHRVYLANGLTTRGVITSTKTGETLKLGARDLAIDPDTGAMDPLSGASQFGRNRDDYGNWFGVHNSYPLWHFALNDRYTRRNPHVTMPDPKNYLILPRNPPVKFRSSFVKRYDHPHRGTLTTSTCSAMIYRSVVLFDEVGVIPRPRHAFTCEPYANLVMRFVVTEDGVTFKAERVRDEDGYEFLSSEDGWFRPVMVRTGPDGSLYVVDMYRYLIEHPQYMPPEGRQKLRPYFRLGDDKGRIYRVVPKDSGLWDDEKLTGLDARELMITLGHASGEVRDRVQQLLIWRGDAEVVNNLRDGMIMAAMPWHRLHILCTLDAITRANPEAWGKHRYVDDMSQAIRIGLNEEFASGRRHAIRIAEHYAKQYPQLIPAVAKLADDPDTKVRQQVAYTLGEWKGDVAGAALAKIALRDGDDPYMLASVMSSIEPHVDAVVAAAVAKPGTTRELRQQLLEYTVAVGRHDASTKLLAALVKPVNDADGNDITGQLQDIARFLDTLTRKRTSLAKLTNASKDEAMTQVLQRIPAIIDAARRIAEDADANEATRVAALGLLGREPPRRDDDLRRLAALLNPRTNPAVQTAAVDAVVRSRHADGPTTLLQGWASHSPSVRLAVLDGLVARTAWASRLVEAVKAGTLPASDVTASHVERLLKSRDKQLRLAAEAVFRDVAQSDRAKVVAAHADALTLDADAARGKQVFAAVCAACHRLDNVGNDVGPNLRSVTDRSPEALLTAILDPNRNVEPRYMAYIATLNDGGAVFGVLTSETGASLTITGLDGKPRTVLRADLQSLRSTNRSLMPDGLEAGLAKQQLADVIAYINQ